MLNYNVKLLTCDDSLHIKNDDLICYKYETKKKIEENVYDSGKRNYCERRGGHWRAPRPRQIRQLETKLHDLNVVLCEWTTESLITIVFSSGAIAYITVKLNSLDVLQILFDRYCVNKLSGQTVTGVIVCPSHLMLTHADRLATLISYGKKSNNIPCRISDRDPHLQTIQLGGPRRSERKLSWCESKGNVKVLVWSTSTAEPAPWSPVMEDHANLHLYVINGQHMALVAYHQMENETLSAELSLKWDCTLHIVEQITCHKNGVNLIWQQYEVPNSEDHPTKLSSLQGSETHVSLPAPARTVKRSPCDVKLLTACIDGSMHVIHNSAGCTHSVRAGFIATEVRWCGDLIIAAEEGGRIQCFDRALSLLHHHTKCFDFTSYIRDLKSMLILATRQVTAGPIILVSFTDGPLALVHISHPRLLTAWLRAGRSSNAVALLRASDWNKDGMECLWAVNKLVCTALKSGTDALSEEGCAQAALGAYLAPLAPHSAAASKYALPVHDLARKFFHHLLRRGRVEKALSLAVDLRAWDLFVDARWAAERRGLDHLASEAITLADHYAQLHTQESDCSDSCSQCSSHSYTDDDTSTSENQIQSIKTKPPPLPRVSMPTVMPVPISQTEPTSTNSIRPNLHQYLERDNTIWNTSADDTYVKITNPNRIKPILSHNGKWIDNISSNSRLGASMPTLAVISESPTKPSNIVDIKQKQEERSHLRNLYRTELREDSNTAYRYSYQSSANDKNYKLDASERGTRTIEKNKVKFSDTVTIAVVSESPPCPENARELADSLPLCPPHKYLADFAPHPRTYLPQHVSQHIPQHMPQNLPPRPPAESAPQRPPISEGAPQRPPKIKVVHFGMV